jgi:glycosyltransferase involved in cell wall biosynthesis
MEPVSKPKVSVNIPVYNGEKTIALAIRSILGQTFADFELIVVNDASKDSTAQILNGFNDPRLSVIHHEQNQGISRTRNTLLRHSRADYVAVLDADDVALARRLERQIQAVRKDPTLDGVFSWVEYFQGEDPNAICDRYFPKIDTSELRGLMLFESPFVHSTAFIRRQVMGQGYREDLSCAEDYAKWLELVFDGKKLDVVQESLVRFWRHQPTNYSSEKMKENVKRLHSEYFARLLGRPLTEEESEIHWFLYQIVIWTPKSRHEALLHLKKTQQWISTFSSAKFHDPKINRQRLCRLANAKFYHLCLRASPFLGVEVLRFASGMTPKERLKLFVKGALKRI